MSSTKLLFESDGEFASAVLRIGNITVMENALYRQHPDGHEQDTIKKVIIAIDNGEEFECPKHIADKIDEVLQEVLFAAQIFGESELKNRQ